MSEPQTASSSDKKITLAESIEQMMIRNKEEKEGCQQCEEIREPKEKLAQIVSTFQEKYPLDDELPCNISGMRILKLQWNDFPGTPNYEQIWSAHAFWGIEYSYTVEQIAGKNKKVKYKILPEVNVQLKSKSWTKKNDPHLLNHEQGHYIIGCFCGLEFKKKVQTSKFTDNYRFEIPRLFEAVFNQHIQLEKRYDYETDHRINRAQQTAWDHFMLRKIKEYKVFFNTPKKNKSSNMVKKSNK